MLKGVLDYHIGALKNPGNNNGIGDAIVALHIIAGLVKKFPQHRIRAVTAYPHVVEWLMLGHQDVVFQNASFVPGEMTIWQTESDGWVQQDLQCLAQETNRINLIAKTLNIEVVKPTIMIPKEVMANESRIYLETMVKQGFSAQIQKPRVILAPSACSIVRVWPQRRWIELAICLNEMGFVTNWIGKDGQDNWTQQAPGFGCLSATALHVSAMMKNSVLVIGNDSGPVHLASVCDVPAIAVMGPTRGSVVFGHYPKTRWTESKIKCAGCLFQQPKYIRPCQNGCEVLTQTTIEPVLELLKEMGIKGAIP